MQKMFYDVLPVFILFLPTGGWIEILSFRALKALLYLTGMQCLTPLCL